MVGSPHLFTSTHLSQSAEAPTNVGLASVNAIREQDGSTTQASRSRTPTSEIWLAQILPCRWLRMKNPSLQPPSELPLPPMISGTQQFAPDSRVRKGPNRQSRSCKVCRLRKVKVRYPRHSCSDRSWVGTLPYPSDASHW